MAIRTTLSLLVLLAAGTACTPTVTQPDVPAGPDALAQVGQWKLQGATDAQGQPIPAALPNGQAKHAISFDNGTVAGLLQGTSEWRIAESYPEQLFLEHADGRRSHWVADRPGPSK